MLEGENKNGDEDEEEDESEGEGDGMVLSSSMFILRRAVWTPAELKQGTIQEDSKKA